MKLVVLAMVIGCSAPHETEQASELISDGAHGGRDGFYFLPPLVAAPDYDGTFDPQLSPTLEIRELGSNTIVTTFAGAAIEVDPVAEHYAVNWDTSNSNLDTAKLYRIAVLLQGYEVGHADVDPVANGRELRNIATSDTIPLLGGRTLPIKFRIEQGVIDDLIPKVAIQLTPFADGRTAGQGFATFGAVGDPLVSYTCRFNGVESTCVSPLAWSLPHGTEIVLEVTATSLATGIQGPPAIATAVVDALTPTIADVEPVGLHGSEVTLYFTSSDTAAVFTCVLDGATLPCEPGVPIIMTSLLDGPHEYRITATDRVGNTNTVVQWFDVDAIGPVVVATRVPGMAAVCPDSNDSNQIAFEAEDARHSPIHFQCSLDGEPWSCSDPFPSATFPWISGTSGWNDLADGEHVLAVIARDGFGNPSDPLLVQFFVDRTGPVVEIETGTVSPSTGSFSITVDDLESMPGSGHEPTNLTSCTITDSAGNRIDCLSTCIAESPLDAIVARWSCSFTGLPTGVTTVQVTATDACGAVNAGTGSATWLVE